MFHQLLKKSKEAYGVATSRPQDNDKDLLITLRRNNLGIPITLPENYTDDATNIARKFKIRRHDLPDVDLDNEVRWLDFKELNKIVEIITNGRKVVGVDMEFHMEDSYDGNFIEYIL